MILLTNLTAEPKQSYDVVLENNQSFKFVLEYVENQSSWFCTITYGTLIIKNILLTTSPNMLRQWKNEISFGLAITNNVNQTDPQFLNDFTNGRISLTVLNQEEVEAIEASIYGS